MTNHIRPVSLYQRTVNIKWQTLISINCATSLLHSHPFFLCRAQEAGRFTPVQCSLVRFKLSSAQMPAGTLCCLEKNWQIGLKYIRTYTARKCFNSYLYSLISERLGYILSVSCCSTISLCVLACI